MPLVSDEAIVLARYPFRETSAIVVFLCRDKGLIRAVARRARGRGSTAAALEPLARVNVTLFLSPRRELATVNEVLLARSCLDLAAKPQAWAAALVAAELALELCPPGTSQEAFFRLLEKTVLWLEGGVEPFLTVHYVLIWVLRLAGVLPDPTRCAVCGKALADSSAFVEGAGFCCGEHGAGGTALTSESRRFFEEALKRPLDAIVSRPGPELLPLLAGLAQGYLEKPLRSLAVFHQLLTQAGGRW